MKRTLSILIILLTLCLPATSFSICGPAPTPGGDWVFPGGFCDNILLVCPTSEYTTIGAAMNAADAWDTILVAEGTYNEAVVFPHDNITLRSQGSAENTIITQGAGTTVSFGTSSGCTLDGFTVTLSAATATGDEVIYSNNNDTTDYNIVENCIIDVENKAGEDFGLYGINIDDGNFALLNNRISVTQTGDGAVYAIWNSAAHAFECRENTITIDQDTVGAYMTVALAHTAGAGGILYAVQNTITTDSEHTGASIGYSVYASANINHVNNNIINAVGAAGVMYGLYTGAAKTGYYNGNFINVTTTDSDGEWANFSTGTSYAHGNTVTGDGVMGTGGTIYGGLNQINDVVKLTAATAQLLLPLSNDAVTPTLAFGDGDTGFYEAADDTVRITHNSVYTWNIDVNGFGSAIAGGGQIRKSGASATVPSVAPNRDDLDTGLGTAAADQLSLIAGGVEGIRISEDTTIQVNSFGPVIKKYTITTDNTNGVGTHTIAELLGGLIRRGTGDEITGAAIDVTDTAANIVAGITGCVVGSGFEFSISNEDSTHTIQLDGGTDVTIAPNDPSTAIPANSTGRFLLVVTNATTSSEAVTVHALGFTTH